MSFMEFFLKKSNSYNYYKSNYEKLRKKEKGYSADLKRHKRDLKLFRKKADFINFDEYLINSFVNPIIETPFVLQDKRCFSFMDHIGKYLRDNLSNSDYSPLVSVIMPTYNRKDIIKNAIDSVLSQTYSNFELIIVDDGSNDGTSNFLKTIDDDRLVLQSHTNNKGVASARNTGLKNAKGEIITYLDSDNLWEKEYLETVVAAFFKIGDADAIYSGQLLYKDYDDEVYAVRFASYNKPLLHNKNYIDMSCFAHKKDICNSVGYFDENLWRFVDWDYILRISNDCKMYSVPFLLSRVYEENSSNRLSDMEIDYHEYASKIIEKNKYTPKPYKNLEKKVSVVIPSYESLNEIKNCINSILRWDNVEMVDIIVVDNNSTKEVKNYLKSLEADNKIKLILNDINYGFTYGVLQGIGLSDEDSDILLLNNDAVLFEGAIEHMQTCAYSLPDCGLVVPHEILPGGIKFMKQHVPYSDFNFDCDVTPSKIHHNIVNMSYYHDGKLLELDFAPFFCTYIKRDVYNSSLGLDAELGRHYRSDRIYSDFIRHILKLKIYQCPESYVYHKHKVATEKLKDKKDDYYYIFEKNQWEEKLAKELGYTTRPWDV